MGVETAAQDKSIQMTLFEYFADVEQFSLKDAKECVYQYAEKDVKEPSIRARIYEGINKGLFKRVAKGVYTVTKKNAENEDITCMLIQGNGRDLSFLEDNSIDAIITDHPYLLKKSLKGGNRDFASYDLFQYTQQDLDEKFRVLKKGHFLVEFLPEENGDNYEYLYQVKAMAKESGFEYYAKVAWRKGTIVANTGRKAKNTEDILLFSKGRARDMRPDAKKDIAPLTKKQDSEGSNFSALDYAGTIDFTYPKATEWYKGLLKNLLDMGVTCIKTDFGENIHMDALYKGMKPELLNNLYALLYQKAAYEITKDVTGDGIVWARSAWAGCQRYPLHWGGDSCSSWDGMAGSLKGGLHFGLSGFAFWSHDVPGFHTLPNFMNSVVADDVYMRWTQFGVFSSHIRYHGTNKREPWHYPAIAPIIKKWWKLRYTLIPYIIAQSRKAISSGAPLLQALIFHHPEDKLCWHIDDEYYFGNDFLVAPVMNSENRRDVYLPEGQWVNFFTGEVLEGGRWLKDLDVPLDEMPVYVRQGATIPVYPDEVECTDEMDLSKSAELHIDNHFKGIFKD